MDAFWSLDSCRQQPGPEGGLPGPIPWTAIVQYADRQGVEEEVTAALEKVMRSLDSAYLRWYASKLPKPKGSPSGRK